MTKPENPYFKRLDNGKTSILWSLFEGEWEDLTVPQIAEVLDAMPATIYTYLKKIKKETGYRVPHADRRRAEYRDE